MRVSRTVLALERIAAALEHRNALIEANTAREQDSMRQYDDFLSQLKQLRVEQEQRHQSLERRLAARSGETVRVQ